MDVRTDSFRFVYTYFRFWCYPSRDKTQNTQHSPHDVAVRTPRPPPPTRLHVNGLV